MTCDWISVDDRLPEDDDDVLVVTVNGTVVMDYCRNGRWSFYDVAWWMPLPEPPKEAKG